MTIFIEVAKQQGFAPAARALDLSTSAVSRYVIDLEDWLGVQLFQRTTRKLSLTDAGKAYLARCQRVVAEIDDIKQTASEQQAEPQGVLRISAPLFIAKTCIQDLLPGYLDYYPHVDVEIVAVDRYVDLIEEGFDLAIRAGELQDSTMIARKLMDVRLLLVASPAYLKQYGMPKTIAELKNHNCLVDTAASYVNHWPITERKNQKPFIAHGRVRVNNGEIARSLALVGVGIALLPAFFVTEDIQKGQLVSFLASKVQFDAGLFAVYPQRRHLSPNVRSFIDYLVEHIDQRHSKY